MFGYERPRSQSVMLITFYCLLMANQSTLYTRSARVWVCMCIKGAWARTTYSGPSTQWNLCELRMHLNGNRTRFCCCSKLSFMLFIWNWDSELFGGKNCGSVARNSIRIFGFKQSTQKIWIVECWLPSAFIFLIRTQLPFALSLFPSHRPRTRSLQFCFPYKSNRSRSPNAQIIFRIHISTPSVETHLFMQFAVGMMIRSCQD